MVGDYISREAAMPDGFCVGVSCQECPFCDDPIKGGCKVARFIDAIPAADVVEVVRCRDCIHRPSGTGVNHDVKFPDDVCPCKCPDSWYSWIPPDDWFCADGKRKDGGQDE